ncbi:hypothetical protein QBC44DRAFT_315989 [Cladorrhinum sp. PSN332]|nr:hypothetical protein QBC44DRAFT_315989 [Cladorrhinum sp. PSN332]
MGWRTCGLRWAVSLLLLLLSSSSSVSSPSFSESTTGRLLFPLEVAFKLVLLLPLPSPQRKAWTKSSSDRVMFLFLFSPFFCSSAAAAASF